MNYVRSWPFLAQHSLAGIPAKAPFGADFAPMEEVSHRGMISLRRCGALFYLQHFLTGEVAVLPNALWSLGLHNERAFAHAPELEALWCKDLVGVGNAMRTHCSPCVMLRCLCCVMPRM